MDYQEFSPALDAAPGAENRSLAFIAGLARACKQAHGATEPQDLERAAENSTRIFNELVALKMNSTILFGGGTCFLNTEIVPPNQAVGELLTELRQLCQLRGLGGFWIRERSTLKDQLALLQSFRNKLPMGAAEVRFKCGLTELARERQKLRLEGPSPIGLIPEVRVEGLLAEMSLMLPASSRQATLAFARLLVRTRLALLKIASGAPATFELAALERAIEAIIDNIDNDVFRSRLLAWTTLRGVERILVHHDTSTAILALCAGRELGFDRRTLAGLAFAATLHDTPSRADAPQGHRLWSEAARSAIRSQTFSRAHLFRTILPYEQLGLHVLDLPSLGEGPAIFESHILALSCAFDRATRDSYTPPYQALRLCSHNTKILPAASAALAAALGVYPRGSLLRLTDGSLAVVLENGRHRLHRPLLRLIERRDGIKPTERTFLDLLDPNAPRIEGALDERTLGLNVLDLVLQGTSEELDGFDGG